MRKVLSFLILVCLLLAACSPAVTTIKMRQTSRYSKVAPDDIKAFIDEKQVKGKYRELGFIVSNSHAFFPIITGIETCIAILANARAWDNHAYSKEIRFMLEKASKMGANAIIIKQINRVSSGISFAGVPIRLL